MWECVPSTMSRTGAATKPGAAIPADPVESLPASCFILRTNGHACCMTKLLTDNRVVVVLFIVLAFLNAFAIQGGWYHA